MTKEEFLRTFLEDDLFTEKGYLKEGEAQKYRWATPGKKLIEVIKIAIEGEDKRETASGIEKTINKYLNSES